jgi:phosphoribosylglycinamide formyltransferase-1
VKRGLGGTGLHQGTGAAPKVAFSTRGLVRLFCRAVTYRVAVAVSGRGSNMLALGDALAEDPSVAISAVLSDRDALALNTATSRGWKTHRLEDHSDGQEWLDILDEVGADLVVLAGYLRLVPPSVVDRFRGRIINIHPALLPRHGGPGMYGRRVHEAVIAAGDSESGATVHLVDEVYDRGKPLGQGRVLVMPDDTPERLAARVLELEHRLLPAAVRAAAAAGTPTPFDFT